MRAWVMNVFVEKRQIKFIIFVMIISQNMEVVKMRKSWIVCQFVENVINGWLPHASDWERVIAKSLAY